MAKTIGIVLIICLVLFSIFRRVRRNIGWQQLNPSRMQTRTILFLVLGALFVVDGVHSTISVISDIVGILLGAAIAYYGGTKTQFEQREGQMLYRPNTWVGSAVIALFFARLIYRGYEVYSLAQSNPGAFQAAQNSSNGNFQGMGFATGDPWTSGLMLIMFAYYVVYNVLLLRKQKQLQASK